MKKSLRLGLSAVAGVALAAVTALIAIQSMGAGHGNYLYAKLLYPFSMIALKFLGEIPASLAIASLLQFPAYAMAIAYGQDRRTMARCGTALATIHVAAIAIAW